MRITLLFTLFLLSMLSFGLNIQSYAMANPNQQAETGFYPIKPSTNRLKAIDRPTKSAPKTPKKKGKLDWFEIILLVGIALSILGIYYLVGRSGRLFAVGSVIGGAAFILTGAIIGLIKDTKYHKSLREE